MFFRSFGTDRTMEQIVFPVPNICRYLTRESKCAYSTPQRGWAGSKVNDFFQQAEDLYNEMKWQKKIRSKFIEPKWSEHNENVLSITIDTPVLWDTWQGSFQLALKFLPSDVTEITYKLKHVSSVCWLEPRHLWLKKHRRFWLIRSSFSADL